MRWLALIPISLTLLLPALSFAFTMAPSRIITQNHYKMKKVSAESQSNNPLLREKQRIWFSNIKHPEES
ncbi:hypothetical protein [Piscirickettsia salmonis]|uniref:hypothetical protein n=1 Tax=Piscirickettsia salmonis TaxID=1238 RepID=UPI0002EE8886|nr:hypothetical protein [Piscirickettsia salmonis]APS56193.1 hypothetical protein AVI52_02415 [Piscirickettsia salmonis]PEQ15208.1 hypothetical protein X973_13985 [Piscirickettsia salmonis]QGN77474.1 hypothetical protein Psal001_01685 [Piscirickettsia salmonis]QGN81061.1 hypothetical protein Psal002_01707 [Piscirickettsia salmonis]QGN84666.1 hypothetical protein Psal003_01724 [Piscirickettsia salmonis]